MTNPAIPASGAAQFILHTLDEPRLERRMTDGGLTVSIGFGKPFAVLVVLALARGRTTSRAQLVDLLWSNAEPDRARQTLRQTLSTLRDVMGDDAIETRNDDISLVCEIDVDAETFVRAVRERRFDDAVASYHRPFLLGVTVPGGTEFDEWVDSQRHRLQSAYVVAVESAARVRLDRGRPHEAASLARRCRDADPLRQSAWRLLIEALVSAGEIVDARLEGEALEHVLVDERCENDPLTRALLGRLARIDVSVQGLNRTDDADASGRDAQFETLMGLWSAATAGTARVATVVGPSNTGKTRLLTDLERRLVALDNAVVAVRTCASTPKFPHLLNRQIPARGWCRS